MLKNYCITSVFSKTGYLVAKHTLIFFSILLHLGSTAVWAEKPQSVDFIRVGFVAFDHGDYRLEQLNEVDSIFNHLQTFSDTVSIHLIGHSHSEADQASKKLAQMRAETVRDELINLGYEASSIVIDYDVQNFVSSDTLVDGVSAVIFSDSETVANVNQPDTSIVSGQNLPIQQSYTNIQPKSDACSHVSISVGSLRTNLEREISDCGYIMGRWRFGDGDEVIDWHVPVAYSIAVDNSLVGLLQLIERNYQIRAHIHELDSSIDFFPTIRDRGNRNQ